MKKVTVVFPMAGEGQRFGNKFKPFLKIFNKTFIELAVEPFLKHYREIEKFIFIFRYDHQLQFDITGKLSEFHLQIPSSIELTDPTKSVIETISVLFEDRKLLKDIIFCDCDHWLNVDAIFDAIQKDEYDCIIPGWDFGIGLTSDDIKRWSIASVTTNDMVYNIKEKEYPQGGDAHYGVIGCYYFKEFTQPPKEFKYLSDIVRTKIVNKKVKLIPIKEAEFFGDPERLESLYISKKASTIFCDLDGTIIEHENIPDYNKGIKLLEGAKDTIDQWRKNFAFIVLTTSRDEQFRSEMELMLREAGIRYEYLVMGLPPGPRYLINDKRPYSDTQMAKSFEVERNIGIKSIGHSFASFEVSDKVGIKTIPLNTPQHQKDKFKSQHDSMVTIKKLLGMSILIPKVSDFTGLSYSIEYLEGYKGLHTLPLKQRFVILEKLFKYLPKLYHEQVYYKDFWLNNFIDEKIISKRKFMVQSGMNDKIILKIQEIMLNHYEQLCPSFLCQYFHGDLTYENIMVKDSDIKLIDFDNDNLPGCPELDMGKLMQSILTNYEHWDDKKVQIWDSKPEFDKVIEFYSELLKQNNDQVANKAYFYCALHLIRMIPYQAKTSERRARLALFWAEEILKRIKWNTN